MRSESLINNMMQPSPFAEFNPLDVLATAASLQSARIETDDEVSPNNGSTETQGVAAETEAEEEKDGDLKDVEVSSGKPDGENVSSNDTDADTDAQDHKAPSDDSVFQVPAVKQVKYVNGVKGNSTGVTTSSTKPVTVLRAYKPQMSDHSYAFMFQLQSLKNDEDEGYSSRSSIDEEGEDISASHGINLDSPDGLRSPTTLKQGKMPKIFIVGKESSITKQLSSPRNVQDIDVKSSGPHDDTASITEANHENSAAQIQCENSIEDNLTCVVESTADNQAEMLEEPVNEVITLDPASVLDSLPPPEEDIDINVSESSAVNIDEEEDTQDATENCDQSESDATASETNATFDQPEGSANTVVSTEAESSIESDVNDATQNEKTNNTSSYNKADSSETNADVTLETEAEKQDSAADQSLKNQYIIEDDVSPVRKFGSADVEPELDVINIAQLADRSEGTVLVVSKPETKNSVRQQVLKPTQSLLKTSNMVGKTNSSVVRVIPFVNGGRVAQILPRPLQCITPIKGQSKTIMKIASPCVEVKKPPTLGKLLMPVTATTLSSTKGIILKSPVPSPTAAILSPAVSTDTSLSGRSTPKSFPDTDSVDSDMSPTPKITMLASDTDLKVKVEKASIGTVGSLSWNSFNGSLIQLGGNGRSNEFIRIQGSQIQQRDSTEEEPPKDDDLSVSLSPNPWAGTSLETASMDDVLSVTNSDDSMLSEPVMSPVVPSPSHSKRRSKTDKIDPDSRWERCSELHPLIDHDYCMFTEFNAQIQSSIIATTESKTRIDRRYNKKTKSARTKTASLIFEPERPLRGRPSEKVLKGKKGRLKKKDAATARGAYVEDNLNVDTKPAVHSKESEEKALKRQLRQEKKLLAEKKKAERNERNFVKITGSYKDDFVYYATRNYRGRPRKAPEPLPDSASKSIKPIPAGGVNDFDWYRDLSRADKTSYFGSPGLQSTDSSRHASPAALPIATSRSEAGSMDKQDSIPGSTPIHESDVVDLVCELSGFGGVDGFTASMSGGVEVCTTEATEEPSNGDSSLDLNQMAEHVCSMLTSMDENELRMLEKLGEDSSDEKPAGSGLNDTSFDGFLGAPVQGQTELCDDLDEINDNDLLTTDISNMNDMSDILTDLRSSATAQTTTSVEGANVQAGTSHVSLVAAATPSCFSSEKLDRAELFPDIHTPSLQNRTESTMVPELIVVSMFWNDLPGLMISSVQHVRLVDIHKQVLPAKDTGILKKRCQMLGLDIANCSELQRDFLIRYANAAKSKSTVIVSKKSAEELIGFYVNPKPRGSRQVVTEEKEEVKPKVDAVSSTLPVEGSSVQTEVSVTLDQAPATPTSSSSSRAVDADDAIPQSKSGKKSRKRKLTGESDINPASPGPVLNVATVDTPPSVSAAVIPAQDVKRSERLRHKKVRYADMANGTAYMEGTDEEEDHKPPASPATEGSIGPPVPSIPVLEMDDSGLSSDHENRDITLQKLVYPEELEIKKIRLKARKKKLTKQEKRRLKRLKERMQKKAHKQKMEKKRLRMLQRQKTSGGKGKRRLQETHAYTKKVNPEHCYAACPAVKEEVEPLPVEKQEIEVKDESVKEPTKAPLAVIHRDNVHRQGTARLGRCQDGEVYLSLYRNRDSACIQCMTCRDFYTVRRFLKHMHKQNNPDELLEVNLPQKFELRNPSPTDGENQDWQEFQTRRRLVELSPNERTRKTLTKPAESNTPSLSFGKDSSDKRSGETNPQIKTEKTETESTATTDTEKISQEPSTPVKAEKEVKVEIHLKSDPQESKSKVGSISKVESSPEENGLTRHSTRVRKRKQLHPIESYVYSKLLPANGKPEMREELPGEIEKVSMSVSPVRATKFKVSVRKDGSSQVTRLDVKVPGSDKRTAKRARYSQ